MTKTLAKLDKEVIDILANIEVSQESIVQASSFFEKLCSNPTSDQSFVAQQKIAVYSPSRVAKIWAQQIEVAVSQSKVIPYIFLAHDLIRKSRDIFKNQGAVAGFDKAFQKVLPDAIVNIFESQPFSQEIHQQVTKLIQVWRKSEVFPAEYISNLEQRIQTTISLFALKDRVPREWLKIAAALEHIETLQKKAEALEQKLENIVAGSDPSTKEESEGYYQRYSQVREVLQSARQELLHTNIHDSRLIEQLDNAYILQSLIKLNNIDQMLEKMSKGE